jgi:hypothetical protein
MITSIECGLCNRPFEQRDLTEHHCKPKEHGGTRADIAWLCRQCHGMVHATYTNATLNALYPTLGQLRLAPELQQPGRLKKNKSRRPKV